MKFSGCFFFFNLNSHSVSKIKGRKLGSLKSIQEEGFIESDGFLDGGLRDRSACLGTLRTTVRVADIKMSSETVHFRMGWLPDLSRKHETGNESLQST